MSTSPERPALPVIVVHAEAAAGAELRVAARLEATGVSPGEVQRLIALIRAGAVESAHAEVADSYRQVPVGHGDAFGEGRFGAVQAVESGLTHIADRTVRQGDSAAAVPEPRPEAAAPAPTEVDTVGEEQVRRVLDAAERIFVSLTGASTYDRDLSEEILQVVLKCVSVDEQGGYVRRLEAFAETSRERLVKLYSRYGPGGAFADESHCYLTHQPESVVICERLDTVPMWLDGVWNDEIDAELVLDRFAKYWRFGL